MADEKQKIKQAQTLSQTAKNVGDPSNMAKIIGAAGGGLWDFLQQSYEHMVPQSVEELALEGSPAGKVLSATLGRIPHKWIKPFGRLMKDKVMGNPKTPYPDIVEEYIDRNPTVAANLDAVTDFQYDDEPSYLLGLHNSTGIPAGNKLLDERGMLTEEHLRSQFEQGLGPFEGLTRRSREGPLPSQYIAINKARLERGDTTMRGRPITPRQVIRHEFGHGAQHAWEQNNYRQLSLEPIGGKPGQTIHESRLPYEIRPTEIGARLGENSDTIRQPLSTRLINELNDPYVMEQLNPDRIKVLLADLNKRLAGQQMQVMYSPGTPNPFSMSRIVLGR